MEGLSQRRKDMAWLHVLNEINAVSPEVRTVADIKGIWFNFKAILKKIIAAHNKEISDTGWGKYTSSNGPSAIL